MASLQFQAFGGAGAVDTSFQPGSDLNNTVFTIATNSDGKILIGGDFTTIKGAVRRRVARLNADGSPDTSFNPGSGADARVIAVAGQPDGKVIIAGDFLNLNGISRPYLARLNADGSLDTSFNLGTGMNGSVESVALQSDGKVLIGGLFTTVNGTFRRGLARLNSNGSLDQTFNPALSDGSVYAIWVHASGKILIGGSFSAVNITNRSRLAQLHPDGTLDLSFTPGYAANATVSTLAVQPNGDVLFGGNLVGLGRVHSDGSLDTDFHSAIQWYVNAFALQSDGKIIVGGSFPNSIYTGQNSIVRLNADGTLDSSFYAGLESSSAIYSLQMQSGGKVLIGGSFFSVRNQPECWMARLETSGVLDNNFAHPRSGSDNALNTLAIQPDGKVLIAGGLSSVGGAIRHYIARLNADGSLDSTFDPGIGPDNSVYGIVLQPDGKVLISGAFYTVDGSVQHLLARLNVNGTLDNSFNTGANLNGLVTSIVVQLDSKILIGGYFTKYGATVRNRVARLNADGSLDATFDAGTGPNDNVECVALQTNGQILIGGAFTNISGVERVRVARLNSGGSLDVSFNAGPVTNLVVDNLLLQQDGKVLIAGNFTGINGVSRNGLARLNTDGGLDMGFDLGTGLWPLSRISKMALQPDGKLLLAATFIVNGNVYDGLARLNSDGHVDTGFYSGSLLDYGAGIRDMVLQLDSKIVIGGLFSSYNGIPSANVARIHGDAPFLVSGPARNNNDFVARFNGTPGLTYTLEQSDSLLLMNWQKSSNMIAPAVDAGMGVGTFEVRQPASAPQRFYRLVYPAY